MVKKKKRKSKKNKLPKEFIMSKKEVKAYQKSLINKKSTKKKETKIFWIIMVALFIGSISLDPEFWIESGKVLWAFVPIIAIGGLWSVFNAKQGEWIDKDMFLLFIGLIVAGLILNIFIK